MYINHPNVIHQAIDGEVIVIHLDTGCYYSLTGTAAAIWNDLECGRDQAAMAAGLRASFSECDVNLPEIISQFLEELQSEKLIDLAGPNHASVATKPTIAPGSPTRFAKPVFQKFTDMRELLLLDPIHEVQAAGWPVSKSDSVPPNHAGR